MQNAWQRHRAVKSTAWENRCSIWETMMRYPKQIWIAYHAPGMTSMLQLCYHKGASKAGSRYMSLALQRVTGMQNTDAASIKRMLRNNILIFNV
jgi:hypothetical protein